MASTGNVFAGAGASVDRAGSTAWTTPGNVTADDASTASAVVPTDYLVSSSYGFNIPANATINGITVNVQSHETGTGSSSYVLQLHSATTPTLIGAASSAVTVTGTTPTTRTNGSASDLWSATLTPAIVNAAGFGVSLWSTDTTNTLLVDFIQIAVEYSVPGATEDYYSVVRKVDRQPGLHVGLGLLLTTLSAVVSTDVTRGPIETRIDPPREVEGFVQRGIIDDLPRDIAASGTLTITGAAGIDAYGEMLAAGALSIAGAADLDAYGDAAASGSLSIVGAADLDAYGDMAAAGALAITGVASLDGSEAPFFGYVEHEVEPRPEIQVPFHWRVFEPETAASDVAATGSLSITGSADLDAYGNLAAAGSLVINGAASLDGTVADAPFVTRYWPEVDASRLRVTYHGMLQTGFLDEVVSDIVASGTLSITGAADLDGYGNVAATGSLAIAGGADLDAYGNMAASGTLSINGAADMEAYGSLVASGSLSITGFSDLTDADSGELSASGALSIAGIADLDAYGNISASGSLSIIGFANLVAMVAEVETGATSFRDYSQYIEDDEEVILAVIAAFLQMENLH